MTSRTTEQEEEDQLGFTTTSMSDSETTDDATDSVFSSESSSPEPEDRQEGEEVNDKQQRSSKKTSNGETISDCKSRADGNGSDCRTDNLLRPSNWYIWISLCVFVVLCGILVSIVYVKYFRTKSLLISDSDSLSVVYQSHSKYSGDYE